MDVKNDNGTYKDKTQSYDEKGLSERFEHHNLDAMEDNKKKLPYPKSVFFIISNEFCERFNYYGMRTILVLYLTQHFPYSENKATIIFHIFTMFVYFLSIFGAILADSWLGKFKTILYLSMVYVCGSIMITLGAVPPLNLPPTAFTMIGLALIALGSGGIKLCVAAFGGDQFKLPEQIKQVTTFFSLFYFSINLGSFISTSITPVLRQDVHCFGEKDCFPLAFGVPAVLMITSIVIFIFGRPLYKSIPPAGNMVVLVCKAVGNAVKIRWSTKKTNPKEHWLDYAEDKYGKELVADIKVLLRVLVLYVPLPVFWALFDQQGSRWTFQATHMNGDVGFFDIKPDQIQMVNPLLILAFIPLYDIAFYPLLNMVGIRRPLQKLTMGGTLAGVAFILSALVELQLEKTYPILPKPGQVQLRVFNGEPICEYKFSTNIPDHAEFFVREIGLFEKKKIPVTDGIFHLEYSITSIGSPNCPKFPAGNFKMEEAKAYSAFMQSSNITHPLIWYEEQVDKPKRGSPMIRALANFPNARNIWVEKVDDSKIRHKDPIGNHNLITLTTDEYKIFIDNKEVSRIKPVTGGVYSVIIGQNDDNTVSKIYEIVEPNSVHLLWLIPQIVVMTLGEVMFSVTGLEFSYKQAPDSMKSVLQACWLLAIAVGNVIIIIIAELKLFESQANEFFLFAGLMFVDMIVFAFIAYGYKPNVRNESIYDKKEATVLME